MPRALSFRGHYLGLFISGGEACNSPAGLGKLSVEPSAAQ